MTALRDVVILGSTGSIGTQAVDVVTAAPDRFRVTAVAAGGANVALLAEQAARLRVRAVGVSRIDAADELRARLDAAWPGDVPPPTIHVGPDATTRLAQLGCDVVLNAVAGSQGLRATLAALEAGLVVALANKESLIAGGPLVTARAAPGQLVAVDSEHSALAQCLRAGTLDEVRRLVLTASGGPFRGRRRAELADATPAAALAHPTWDMGKLVTTNSATLVNKGLEVIEAHLLFGVPYDRIDVVVHPQSVIHSMVEFTDGSTIAQASPPDMRLPIALALGWPARVPGAAAPVDWTSAQTWTFEPLDADAFPAVDLARRAGLAGGCAPAVYNAANEALVTAFHDGAIGFLQIVDTIGDVLAEWLSERHRSMVNPGTVVDVEQAEEWARHAPATSQRDRRHPPDRPDRSGEEQPTVPSWLLYTLGVLIFAFGLLLSIALHEIGHMVPAKKFGVKVTQYMVGFGPTIWSRKRGDTEYGLKGIPVGGYIRMIGMVPPRPDGKVSRWPRRMATAVEDFRRMSRAEVDPADEDRQFYRLTPGKKMIVMLGGPCMNLLIFLVLFTILITTLGKPHQDETTTVGTVLKCVVPADAKLADPTTCPADAPATPALASLKLGDTFESINGTKVTDWDQLSSLIRPAAGQTLTVVVKRAGQDVTLHITPVANRNFVDDAHTKIETVGFIGFAPKRHDYYKAEPITAVPGQIGSQIKLGLSALGKYPAKIQNLYGTVFEGKKRDPNGAVGVVGIGRISGDYARSDLLSLQDKVFVLINLLAGVNLLLFLFNLLPLLPLDGGHVAGAIVESIKRGRARLRERGRPPVVGPDGQPVPPPHRQIFVDTASMLPVMYGVASILIVLTLLTLYADIVKPINPLGG